MPGEGLEVHESGSPPSAGQIRDAGGNGVLWKRPDGSVFLAMGPADFRQASPEQVEYANRPPAEVQAEGIEAAVSPGMVAEPGAPNVMGQGATEANRARFTSGGARAAEEARAGTEQAVLAAAAEQRRQEADPYFGIDMGERGQVAAIMTQEGLSEEEAIEEYKQRRSAMQQGELEEAAALQAGALEGAEVPPE